MQLDYVHTHRVLKENHAMKYVEPMVCVMYLTIDSRGAHLINFMGGFGRIRDRLLIRERSGTDCRS
jgi:hypothetical protein